MKNNKGFTLVELIVILAIIAILTAVALPRFEGYADMAKQQSAILECRNAVTAAQALYIENYENPANVTTDEIRAMANVSGQISGIELSGGEPVHLVYTTDEWTVTYCRDFESCPNHSELYSITPTGEAGSGGDVEPEPEESPPPSYAGYFNIGGDPSYRVSAIGDLETYDFGMYGELIPTGSVFYWKGDYYYTRNNQYLTNNNNRDLYIASFAMKMKGSGFTTPGVWTQPGDLIQRDGRVYIFFPYNRFQNDYLDNNYWFEVNIS